MAKTIDGPLGPFEVPESSHPRTAEVCEQLSRQVFEGEYEHPELPGPADVSTVVDVGAGWGAFTVWALARWRCVVRAYEPHGKAVEVWKRNVIGPRGFPGHLGSGYAYVQEAAVTSAPCPRLNGCEDWGAYHTVGHPAADSGWPVDGVDPRDLLPCDVLKVDAEGAEVDILSNYRYLAKCRAVLVEFHSPELRAGVREVLEPGFRLVKDAPADAPYGVQVWVRG